MNFFKIERFKRYFITVFFKLKERVTITCDTISNANNFSFFLCFFSLGGVGVTGIKVFSKKLTSNFGLKDGPFKQVFKTCKVLMLPFISILCLMIDIIISVKSKGRDVKSCIFNLAGLGGMKY